MTQKLSWADGLTFVRCIR